ncbi:MAG TPA: PDZ domain-containing protein [Thermoplasmata archaeon]|nr:PDZ domain-containing protein [Thermoplasmata archaeon]
MVVEYSVSFDKPENHRVRVTTSVESRGAAMVDLVLPSWVPGSYWIQEYVRHVRGLVATAGPERTPAPVERVEKARWRIGTLGAARVDAVLEVYAHDLVTEGVDLSRDHLFLNAALCLPYVDGRKDESCELLLHLPPDWRVYTELEEVARNPYRFRARDYDELVDSPLDCGRPVELTFSAVGVPHRIVLCGSGGNYEAHRLEEDHHKLAEAHIRFFGECPVPRYTFFYHLTDVPDGGLEHRASFSGVVPRTTFKPAKSYEKLLRLASHEYFHLYNVKRIRPALLGPFDYTREVYTRLLWAMEGTTTYYGDLLLRRAGLVTPERYLERLGSDLGEYFQVPGRAVRSLEQASLLSWIDFYRPYEETVNQSVSYYAKGALVSWALDLEIRHATENRASLDSVWRRLWTDFGRVGRGIEEDELPRIARAATGVDLDGFFARYVSGTEDPDFERLARRAGLKLAPKAPKRESGETEPGYLGIETRVDGGFVRVTSVRDGSPARRGGIDPGDEIVALDGIKVSAEKFPESFQRFPPGSIVPVTVFRRGLLTEVEVTTGKAPAGEYEFSALDDPGEAERKVYESWLEATWPKGSGSQPSESAPGGGVGRPP